MIYATHVGLFEPRGTSMRQASYQWLLIYCWTDDSSEILTQAGLWVDRFIMTPEDLFSCSDSSFDTASHWIAWFGLELRDLPASVSQLPRFKVWTRTLLLKHTGRWCFMISNRGMVNHLLLILCNTAVRYNVVRHSVFQTSCTKCVLFVKVNSCFKNRYAFRELRGRETCT